MPLNINETFELLFSADHRTAFRALQQLQKASEETSLVYPYMDRLCSMLDSPHSYIRTRGLILIACNAKWDQDDKLNAIIGRYLEHITDRKPITARQCIQHLSVIARDKPELKSATVSALHTADFSVYAVNM